MCLFCDFVSGKKKKHTNGFVFSAIHETKHSISFLSINLPQKGNGHVLVIPKKHFENLEDMPKNLSSDLIEHVKLLSKVLRKTHNGCNILLNDGTSAGQTIFHVHFHIIPRDYDDSIKVEVWRQKKYSKKEFSILSRKIKRHVKKEL